MTDDLIRRSEATEFIHGKKVDEEYHFSKHFILVAVLSVAVMAVIIMVSKEGGLLS